MGQLTKPIRGSQSREAFGGRKVRDLAVVNDSGNAHCLDEAGSSLHCGI